jgi:hypothetical protein
MAMTVAWSGSGAPTPLRSTTIPVVGLFQNQLRLLGADIQPAGGDLTWASGPGKTYRITASGALQSFPQVVDSDIESQGASTNRTFSIPSAL